MKQRRKKVMLSRSTFPSHTFQTWTKILSLVARLTTLSKKKSAPSVEETWILPTSLKLVGWVSDNSMLSLPRKNQKKVKFSMWYHLRIVDNKAIATWMAIKSALKKKYIILIDWALEQITCFWLFSQEAIQDNSPMRGKSIGILLRTNCISRKMN